MDALLSGILLGIGLTLITGPILFALIQTSINQGTLKGQILAGGIWVSDILYAGLLLYFSRELEGNMDWDNPWIRGLSFISGLVMLGMGGYIFLGIKQTEKNKLKLSNNNTLLFSKGFAINTFNPFTIFFWVSVITGSKLGTEYTEIDLIILISAIILTIIAGDNLKIFLAARIGKLLNQGWKRKVEWVTGLMFLGFGLYLIYLFFAP